MTKPREIKRQLISKGFRSEERKNHTALYFVDSAGRKTLVHTWLPRGSREIRRPLLGKMASQCHLSLDQFSKLVSCAIDQQSYEDILRDRAVLQSRQL